MTRLHPAPDSPTHAAFWAALLAQHATRPRSRATRWTQDEVRACLVSWTAAMGRPPKTHELAGAWQLPNYTTLKLFWPSVQACYAELGFPCAAYQARHGQRMPRPPRRRARERRGHSNCTCLMCGERFASEDPRLVRVCTGCKSSDDWHEGGAWMNGAYACRADGWEELWGEEA